MFVCWLKRFRAGVSARSPRPSSQARRRAPSDDRVGPLPVARGPLRLAQGLLEVGRLAQGEGELQRERHGAAVRVLGRDALREVVAPVEEVPPGQAAEEVVRPQPLREPVEDGARARELPAHEGGVVPPRPVVVDHPHPQEGERRDELLRGARVAAEGDPLGAPRAVEVVDGLPREPVVPGHRVGDEGLDPGVADVLELLVVGAVHVRLVGARARRPPPHLPEAAERRVARVEAGALLERVGGEVHGEAVEGERLVFRLDVDLHVAPGAPPERVERAPGTAVGEDLVLVPGEALALERVAVPLLPRLPGLEERLLVADDDPRPAAAGEEQLGIGGDELAAVDQERRLRARGNDGRTALGEGPGGSALGLHDAPRGHGPVLHGRQLVGDEEAPVRRQRIAGGVGDRAGRGDRGDDGRRVAAARRARLRHRLRGPVVLRRVEPLAGPDDQVLRVPFLEGLQALGPRLVARLDRALPGRVGARRRLRAPVALDDEAGAVGDLRGRGLRAEVPDDGREQVPPGLQEGREVEGLEAPEQDVAARRADPHAAAVHAQDEALVRAHVHDEAGRDGREVDHLAEAVDARVPLRRAGAGDPGPRPLALENGVRDGEAGGGGGRGRRAREADQGGGDGDEGTGSHETALPGDGGSLGARLDRSASG